ncbi:MAG: YigZ family protein [Mucilaginibacter polytrichastri]|nr:YigZ family protein [Mucilaginibacter polytrichastri]
MLFDDAYRTVTGNGEGVYSDRGSKFIGYAFPVSTGEEVKICLADVRQQHPKARHYCWALRLTPDRSVFRINDDGEPAGSAARPMLNVLLSRNLTNVLVVVVRYFGGTLLGIPGLINAYRSATEAALDEAGVQEKFSEALYEVLFDYPDMNAVMQIVKEEALNVQNKAFDNTCRMRLFIRKSRTEAVLSQLDKIGSLNHKYISG